MVTMKSEDDCFLAGKYNKTRQCVEKKKHYSADKGPYSQDYVFSAVTYGCESWTTKKAECQRIDAFQLRCWIRLRKVPWTARKSNQSILREINSKYSLEGLMMNPQYFGHLIQMANSMEKSLMLAKIEGRRTQGLQRM